MIAHANPLELADCTMIEENNQTIELRSPDGSTNAYFLLASMAVAARCGIENPDGVKIADSLYIKADAAKDKSLKQLPASCWEAADCLAKDRDRYEEDGVFPKSFIDSHIKELKKFDDLGLSTKLANDPAALKTVVDRHLHCG